MRILLFGKVGQLGWELRRSLAPLGNVIALDYPDVDFTQLDRLRDLVLTIQPDAMINAVAFTAVDRAETEPDKCRLVNAAAPGLLAKIACQWRIPFIHYSTDYVFDGKKASLYYEDDQANPLNMYGQSKLEGEQAIQEAGGAFLIFRTSWVYSVRQGGFVSKVLQWAREQAVLRVVDDQISGPTCARMLAEVTAQIVSQGAAQPGTTLNDWVHQHAGLYHLAGSGYASRYDWAREILRLDPHAAEQVTKELLPARTEDFPSPAARPLFSALDCQKFTDTFGLALPDWKHALALAMDSETR